MGSNEAIGERGNNIVEKGFDVPACRLLVVAGFSDDQFCRVSSCSS